MDPNMKILIVDDVASMRNVTKSILLAADHTNIAQAEDGDEALKILQAEKFDLIICD